VAARGDRLLVGPLCRWTCPPTRPDAADRIVDELEALERRCLAAGLEVDGCCRPPRSPPRCGVRSRSSARRGRRRRLALALGLRRAGRVSAPTRRGTRSTGSPSGHARRGEWLLVAADAGGRPETDDCGDHGAGGASSAARRAEHDRTSGAADAELRRRHGFAVTARTRHEHDATTRREIELAEGHAAFRFTGYLAVTADDEDSLANACGRLEQSALQAQLELHRMYGPRKRATRAHCRPVAGAHEAAAHESTTAQLGAAYPFVASPPLPTSRVLIGQDLAGGPFAHDPSSSTRRAR